MLKSNVREGHQQRRSARCDFGLRRYASKCEGTSFSFGLLVQQLNKSFLSKKQTAEMFTGTSSVTWIYLEGTRRRAMDRPADNWSFAASSIMFASVIAGSSENYLVLPLLFPRGSAVTVHGAKLRQDLDTRAHHTPLLARGCSQVCAQMKVMLMVATLAAAPKRLVSFR